MSEDLSIFYLKPLNFCQFMHIQDWRPSLWQVACVFQINPFSFMLFPRWSIQLQSS